MSYYDTRPLLNTLIGGMILFVAILGCGIYVASTDPAEQTNPSLDPRLEQLAERAKNLRDFNIPDVAAHVEPDSIEFYTYNDFYAGASLRLITQSGRRRFRMPELPDSNTPASVKVTTPGRMTDGWTLQVRSQSGKYVEFKSAQTGNTGRGIMWARLQVNACPELSVSGSPDGDVLSVGTDEGACK